MKTVYRMEMFDGVGPYNSDRRPRFFDPPGKKYNDDGVWPDEFPWAHTGERSHPSVASVEGFQMGYLTAMDSLESFTKWFGEYLDPLLSCGGKVWEVQVTEALMPDHTGQTAFNKDREISRREVTREEMARHET